MHDHRHATAAAGAARVGVGGGTMKMTPRRIVLAVIAAPLIFFLGVGAGRVLYSVANALGIT